MTTLKQIPGHSQYAVSMDGKQVVRIEGGKRPNYLLSQCFHKVKGKEYPNGYMYVTILTEDAKDVNGEHYNRMIYKPMPVHRLVAKAWLIAPDSSKTEINHKDGNKLNNASWNLEWVTHSENIKHSFKELNRNNPKGSDHWRFGVQLSTKAKAKMSKAKMGAKHPKYKGDYICNYATFESMNQAAKQLKISTAMVKNRCLNPKWRGKGWYFVPKT